MKVKTKTMMVRVLVSAMAVGFALPAMAQDRERRGERGDESSEEREAKERQREERRAARETQAQENSARQEVQVQSEPARQERQGYDQEAQRAAAYEAARQNQQPQEQQRAVERQGANARQQQAIDQRAQQMREDESRRVESERQARGYGETRDGNRDWNDGRGDRDRGDNDRDGRYAGGDNRGDRDRDGRGDNDRRDNDRDGRYAGGDNRGDRDGNRGRDGRGDNRWDQNAQRRYDGYQRSADQYRRQAIQRHNSNRYASLQQQQRNRQYRYQQDYWQRQRTWHSGWNNRRFDRNYIFAPVVYRYSRGGRWYDVNQYAADTLQEAIRLGYQEGARAGDADRYDGWRGDYRDNFVYQDADFGFDGYYVALPDYQFYFREGFRRGYEDAYGRRYRYGRASNGEYIIAAAALSVILNLQNY